MKRLRDIWLWLIRGSAVLREAELRIAELERGKRELEQMFQELASEVNALRNAGSDRPQKTESNVRQIRHWREFRSAVENRPSEIVHSVRRTAL